MTTRLKSAVSFLRERPLDVILWKTICKMFNTKMRQFAHWQKIVAGKRGVEIGGPSRIFSSKGFLPLYPFFKSLDGVNFSTRTIWEGSISEDSDFVYNGNCRGRQYISEGTSLTGINDGSYDIVLSCNNLEHIANPIKAIVEWKRVIVQGGALILILPKKESNFDHKRTITRIEHLISDYKRNVQEDDQTHIEEVLRYHDLKRDPQAGSWQNFKKRCEENLNNRAMHHHVFDIGLLTEVAEFADLRVTNTYSSLTDHFIVAVKE